MKKIIWLPIFVLFFLLIYYYRETIFIYGYNLFENKYSISSKLKNNDYSRKYNFKYVSLTNNFSPNNEQDLRNIYYTIINSGMDNFIFYCPKEYETCINDVSDIANSQVIIANINSFVHPYNEVKDLEHEINSLTGKVSVHINKKYSNDMINYLNNKIDEIINKNIKNDMNDKEKIKVIHDYIINNTKYDKDRSDNNIINYHSETAYGALNEGYAICSGYSDTMMLFLEKFNIKNYKKTSKNHIWNYVYLDNNWYNLDLTWDDYIDHDGNEILHYGFFLISNEKLLELDPLEHIYDKTVYDE